MIPAFFFKFPLATFGRLETPEEFLQKYEGLKNQELLPVVPTVECTVLSSENGSKEFFEMVKAQSYPHWPLKALKDLSLEWVAVLDGKAILSPVAFSRMLVALQKTNADLLYPNEIWMNGQKPTAFITKRGYAPVTLQSWNYLGPFFLVRRSILLRALELNPEDFTSLSRLLAKVTEKWEVVPEFLVYRNKVQIPEGIPSATVSAHSSGVSVIICFRDQSVWTIECLKRLSRQKDVVLEVVLVNNGSRADEAAKIREACEKTKLPFHWIDYDKPFNFAKMHNLAVEKYAKGEILLFLNNDVFLESESTIARMVSKITPKTGTVGIRLVYPNGKIQHAGLEARFGGSGRMVRVGNNQTSDFLANLDHENAGNTFAACAVSRAVYDRVNGLRENELCNGFGDVAFNLECTKRGLQHIYLGTEWAIHLESATRGQKYEYWEENVLERDYPSLLEKMLREDFGTDRVAYRLPNFKAEGLRVFRWVLKKFAPWAYQLRQAHYWRQISSNS